MRLLHSIKYRISRFIKPGSTKGNETNALPAGWAIYSEYIRIHPSAIIDPSSTIKIFNPPDPPRICIEIGAYSHIFSSFALLRPQAKISIGCRNQLGASGFICADSIIIEDDVLMAWACTIMDNDSHALLWQNRSNDVLRCYEDYKLDKSNFIKRKDWSNVQMGPIVIHSRAWIGFNVTILKNVSIGEESVVGASSVVAKDVPPRTIIAGNPARVVKKIDDLK